MLKKCFLSAAMLLVCVVAGAQSRNFRSIDYTPKQYGIMYEARNLAIAQDQFGVMYFGNANGIMQFNGADWKHIPLKTGVWVQSILVSSSNAIYAGAQNEFGMYIPGDDGNPKYVSLSDSIVEQVFPFSDVWKIFEIDGRIVFQAYEYIFIFDGKTINIIEPETSFHNSFAVNGKFYVRQRGIGLMELVNGQLRLVSDGAKFADIGVFGMLALPNGQALIATYDSGTYIMDATGIRGGIANLNSALKRIKFNISGCAQLDPNTIVFGSFDNGFAVFSSSGDVIAHKNIYNYLLDNTINSLFRDREGNLWVTTNKGISCFANNENLSIYNIDDGVDGSINAITRFNGRLLLGTSYGMLVENTNRSNPTEQRFVPLAGLESQIWDFMKCNNKLIFGASDGVYELHGGGGINKVSEVEAYCLCYSHQTKTLFAGGRYGLTTYTYHNGWKQTGNYVKTLNVSAIAIDSTSCRGKHIVWLGSTYQGVVRIIFDGAAAPAITQFTYETDGISPGRMIPIMYNNRVIFNNNGHLFNFLTEDEMVKNLPDSLKKDERFYRGSFQDAEINAVEGIYYLTQTSRKTWVTTGINVGYIIRADSTFNDIPFRGIDVGKINTIYPENSGVTWIGATDGLVEFNENVEATYSTPFSCIIYGLKIGGVSHSRSNEKIEVSYKDNSLAFQFVAPWFRYPGKIQYSYILEGLMDEWSEWSAKQEANFLNMREGAYSFKVKARNAFGIESPETTYNIRVDSGNMNFESSTDQFAFSITPPWYRSVWAFILYVLAGLALLFGVVKYYTYQLKERNRYLEQVVAERTREVVEKKEQIELQNADLEKQNALILSQKAEITDSIRYAEHIQRAMLSDIRVIRNHVSDVFILFKPRDIVSGDFYWCSEIDEKLIVVAADCTGHGVPGAFMSMLGISSLNLVVNEKRTTNTGRIVTMLRENIINSFGDKKEQTTDGMDICMVAYDRAKRTIQYTGANNSLLLVRGGEITEMKADKKPVGYFAFDMSDFTTTEFEVQKGDCLYLFSDGYCDQFGGQTGKKFMKANFKKKLVEINQHSMDVQKELLISTLDEHRAGTAQIDDILVIGLRV